ncbi:MAG: glycosyltransferase family 4 protein [Planctomycetales bacterium]|nr:glycosyltransferase family 4 protein [Planctomycetales bacterium]
MSRQKRATASVSEVSGYQNLILVVRADPIICGHSTEARNLAEAAIARGFSSVHIVSYPLDVLADSGLPLKPIDSIAPYSPGIFVDRPAPVGDYKVLDGRLGYAIAGHLVDLVGRLPGRTAIMNLYLVPHGQMVMQAADALAAMATTSAVTTIAEAVGSDVTNVVKNAMATGQFGAAALVLSNYLAHDLPVAVSKFTRELIVAAGSQVDEQMGTDFAARLEQRVRISYPAIDTQAYLNIERQVEDNRQTLARRGLNHDGFLLFLSRLSEAKGVDDLIHAYRASQLYGCKTLVVCGAGPDAERLRGIAGDDPHVRFFADVGDEEKGALMHACHAYCLPSKPRPEFTETFGIALAEAMLAGGPGPVITTRTGGIPEATGDFCLYHRAGDVGELTARLNDIAAMPNESRRSLSRSAQEYARRFDRVTILDNLLSSWPLRAVA